MRGSSRRVTGAMLLAVAVIGGLSSCGPTDVAPSTAPGATPTASSASAAVPSPSSAPSSVAPSSSEPSAGLAAWTALKPSGGAPSARGGQTWVVDPSSAIAYLFGGRGGAGDLNDLWAYDLTSDTWQRLAPAGELPPARHDHVAAWIDGLGVVVFGGRTDAGALDDLWVYDPQANAWRTLDVAGAGPAARSGACAAVRSDGRLWLSGGAAADGSVFADIWVYDPGPSTWTAGPAAGTAPPGRSEAACWWTPDDRFVVHGGAGSTATALGDTWTLSASGPSPAWMNVDPGLSPRSDAAMALHGDGTVLVGGGALDGSDLADLVVFDPSTLASTRLEGPPDGPPARRGGSLVDDPEGERLVLFGGDGPTGPLADLWSLDLP